MSRRAGTLVRVKGSVARSAAQRIGRAAFFAPDMAVSPERRTPPSISSLSIAASLQTQFLADIHPLRRGKGLQLQGVDLVAHQAAEGGIHRLVLAHPQLALEGGTDHDPGEM